MQQIHVFANGDVVSFSVYIVAGVVLLLMLWFTPTLVLAKFYKRCPSNRILVIYGKTSTAQAAICIAGGAQFVKPLIQDYAWLSLDPIRVGVQLGNSTSLDKHRVSLTGAFTVAIGTTSELMQNAAIRLLGLSTE